MHWDKLTHDEINNRIQQAIGENINYRDTPLLGNSRIFS